MSPASRRGFLIVVSGLLAEARIAAGSGVRAIAGGGDPARLAFEVERAIGDGGAGLLSFGMAGGLEPGIAPGTVVVAGAVVAGEERLAADRDWSGRLRLTLPESLERDVAGVDAPVAGIAAKQALGAQ